MKRNIAILLILFIISLLFSDNKEILSGKLTKDISPIYISKNYIVPTDSILIIEPGVTIFFQGNYDIEINGTIIARGTISDSIYFGTLGKKGWNGIKLYDKTHKNKSIFEYCGFFKADTHNPAYKTEKSALTISDYNHVDINNCSFFSNKANYGGAISIFSSNVNIKNSIFRYNYAGFLGGSIVVASKSFVKISNCIFEKNTTDYYGGAIFVDKKSYLTVSGCLFDKNGASTAGAINVKDATLTLVNNTITANNANYGGGIVASEKSELVIINSIIWGNVAGENDNFKISKDTTLQIRNSITEKGDLANNINNIDINEVIFKNPRFNLTGKNPFSLADNSPAIDAGSNEFIKNILQDKDLAGNIRVSGEKIDIGAFEKNKTTLDEKSDYRLFFLKYDLENEKFIGKIKFNWNSNKPALIKIINENANTINKIKIDKPKLGENIYIWNGLSMNNKLMEPGVYFYKVYQFNK